MIFWTTVSVDKTLRKDSDKAKNVGFRVCDQGVVTYEQNKLGLCAYYDSVMPRPMAFIQNRQIFKLSIKDVLITIERL